MKTLIYLVLASLGWLATLQRQAEEHDPEALFKLSTLYERGYDSIPADTARSLRLLRASAEAGYAPARNYLGYLYRQGEILVANEDSARYWIGLAAHAGDPKAANNLGFMLLEENSPASDSLAVAYLAQAADAGLPVAVTTLGSLYAEGRGVGKDTTRAVMLFEKAIEAGFPDAELRLLNLKGKEWLELPASRRLEMSMRYWRLGSPLIGMALLDGLDKIERPETVSESDDLSTPERARVYSLLGYAYSHGAGVGYDHAKANKFFAAAALLGNPAASFIFAETLDIFPGLISAGLFTEEELETLKHAGADLDVTADELRAYASAHEVKDAPTARQAILYSKAYPESRH